MVRTLVDRVSLLETYPSVIAGAFAVAFFGAALLLLGWSSPLVLGDLLLPFALGFVVFMLFYFVVMLLVEPFLRP